MSRDKGLRSALYDPAIIFNLRRQDEGGELGDAVRVEIRRPAAQSATQLYVLIHGFNNHRGEAEAAYQGFRDRQKEHSGDKKLSLIAPSLRDLFWPGDADWAGPVDYLDFFVYPKAVATARQAGEKIADYLINFAPTRELNFIGHSLGCRVVLETIAALNRQQRDSLMGKVCLMAAAVPVFMLNQGARLDGAGFSPTAILNLISKSDKVLHLAFPPGQTAAGPFTEGFFPNALGRHGMIHPRIVNKVINKARHGDYWGHSGGPESDERSRAVLVNKHINNLFGWNQRPSRTIDPRQSAYERVAAQYETKVLQKRMPAYARQFKTRKVA